MGNILPTKHFIKVSLLYYDAAIHKFSPDIHIECEGDPDSMQMLQWRPSNRFMSAYHKWNSFEAGIPHFQTICQVQDFNNEGARLCELLQDEVKAQNNESFQIRVLPFRPLYSVIELGSVTSWWHIRDANYPDVIIPIQHLPVSEDLKMKLQAWRMRIAYDSFDKEHRKSFNEEGHELQREITSELNCIGNYSIVEINSTGRQESFDQTSFPVPTAIAIE